MRLKFYRVEEWYTDELKKVSPSVTDNGEDHVNTYVGILFNINDIDYIAPLTHTTKNSKWHQHPIIIKDQNGRETNRLGTILFHNMIPVCTGLAKNTYKEVDLDSYKTTDIKKYNLYSEQLNWMNKLDNKETIINKANKTYNVHTNSEHRDHTFLNDKLGCKFKELEVKMNSLK